MTSRLIIAALLFITTCPATEKYSIVGQAKLIVFGTLPHHAFLFPWFDGWHIDGTIDVDEVVFGTNPSDPLNTSSSFVWDFGSEMNFHLPPAYSTNLINSIG